MAIPEVFKRAWTWISHVSTIHWIFSGGAALVSSFFFTSIIDSLTEADPWLIVCLYVGIVLLVFASMLVVLRMFFTSIKVGSAVTPKPKTITPDFEGLREHFWQLDPPKGELFLNLYKSGPTRLSAGDNVVRDLKSAGFIESRFQVDRHQEVYDLHPEVRRIMDEVLPEQHRNIWKRSTPEM